VNVARVLRCAAAATLLGGCASWFDLHPDPGWQGGWRLVTFDGSGAAVVDEDGARRPAYVEVVAAMKALGFGRFENWTLSSSGRYLAVTGWPADVSIGGGWWTTPNEPAPLTVVFDTSAPVHELCRLKASAIGWDEAHQWFASLVRSPSTDGDELVMSDLAGHVTRSLVLPGRRWWEGEGIVFSPDGSSIAYYTRDRLGLRVVSWDGATSEVCGCFLSGDVGQALAWLPDGRIACNTEHGLTLGYPNGELDHVFDVGARSCRPDGNAATYGTLDWQMSFAVIIGYVDVLFGRKIVFRDGRHDVLWNNEQRGWEGDTWIPATDESLSQRSRNSTSAPPSALTSTSAVAVSAPSDAFTR
jgi:hypothetical protein